MPEFQPGDTAMAAIALTDHLSRALVTKGVLSAEESKQAILNAINFLAASPNPQAQAAADVLRAFYSVTPKA